MRQAAYAKEVAAARSLGETVNLFAFTGQHAWRRAKSRPAGHRIVIPVDHESAPEDFDFTGLRQLDIVLNAFDADILVARRIAVQIVAHGARMCVLLHPALQPSCSEFFYSAGAR